jgi:hypothetical protein
MVKCNFGGKLIVASGGMALASMFMDWAHFLFVRKSGATLGLALLLLLWLYPMFMVLRNKPIDKFWGNGFGLVSITVAVAFLLYASNKKMAFFHVDVVDKGAWLFLGASLLYFFGIILYRPSAAN